MKVATILPQTYLDMTEKDDYLMALAHLINEPGMERYTEFFKEKGQDDDAFVILDNGVIEGDPRPIKELLMKARLINADELVLPDAFRECTKTLHLVEEATNFLINHHEEVNDLGFMAVPQGKTFNEWINCAMVLIDNPAVTCLGIPKVLIDIAGRDGRLKAIQRLTELTVDLGGKDIHLLGCWRTPLEVSVLAKYILQGDIPEIRGVDSAIAYNMARAGIRLNEDDRSNQAPIDFKDGKIENETLLLWNVVLWRDSVDMNPDKNILFI